MHYSKNNKKLFLKIKDNGKSPRSITWGQEFVATYVKLPTVASAKSKKNRVEKYITFREQHWLQPKLTKLWHVDTTNGNQEVGIVKWHGAWRKYCFFASEGTLFDKDCLRMLADFCEQKTIEH